MSAKRSWDIQPKKRAPAPAARPAERRVQQPARPIQSQPVSRPLRETQRRRPTARASQSRASERLHIRKIEKAMPEPQARAIRKPPPVPGRDREPLKERRRRARRRSFITLGIFLFIVIAGAYGSLWLRAVRIQTVDVAGSDPAGMQSIASADLSGTYDYLFPRNSIFFFPEAKIRTDILKQYPDIATVSISRASFSTITIASIPRQVAFLWCGTTYPGDQPIVDLAAGTSGASSTANLASSSFSPGTPPCFTTDAQGIIFGAASLDDASSSQTLKLYAPLAGNADTSAPIGATIAEANVLPNALLFVKAIESLGVPIVSFVIRGDEADLYAQSGTRITYVLGHEEVTAQVAAAAFPSLNLNDGSLEYVDLRFEGKAYYKKVGSGDATAATST